MTSARITVPGFLGLVMMGVFDLAYVSVTPCSLTMPSEFHSVPWAFDGCSFGMQTSGLFVTAAGALVGFVLGWVIMKGPMGHR